MNPPWPFNESRNVAVITLSHILDGASPILFVSHDAEDGGWQFLDGAEPNEEAVRIVALHRILSLDPGIAEVADLPLGWSARRASAGGEWRRSPQEG